MSSSAILEWEGPHGPQPTVPRFPGITISTQVQVAGTGSGLPKAQLMREGGDGTVSIGSGGPRSRSPHPSWDSPAPWEDAGPFPRSHSKKGSRQQQVNGSGNQPLRSVGHRSWVYKHYSVLYSNNNK